MPSRGNMRHRLGMLACLIIRPFAKRDKEGIILMYLVRKRGDSTRGHNRMNALGKIGDTASGPKGYPFVGHLPDFPARQTRISLPLCSAIRRCGEIENR